jgi:hypothetical protein
LRDGSSIQGEDVVILKKRKEDRRAHAVTWWSYGTLLMAVVALTACAPKLSPLQERAWDAFQDCKQKAPSAVLNQIHDDGQLSYSAREGDAGIMQRCLEEKFGYRSH